MPKLVRFNITPQTHVRATQGDRILFRIPREKLHTPSLKRVLRLEKYNDYKESIRSLAINKNFVLPEQGCTVKFYIPVPQSWQPWQKEAMHLKLHQQRPDIDNLFKALGDSLMKEDKAIGQVSISKQWVNNETGWIEFLIEKPQIGQIIFPKKRIKK